jgi:hypothetical protein
VWQLVREPAPWKKDLSGFKNLKGLETAEEVSHG